ncbi:MAG: hypothetical protein WKG07_44040 [Hymenobacter sp.]
MGNSTYKFQQAQADLYGGEVAFNIHPTALPWVSLRTGAALVIGLNQNPELRARVGAAGRYLPLIPAPSPRSEVRFTAPEKAEYSFHGQLLPLHSGCHDHPKPLLRRGWGRNPHARLRALRRGGRHQPAHQNRPRVRAVGAARRQPVQRGLPGPP